MEIVDISQMCCAIMEDWNWALGYGIGKDVETGKDIFVHHSFLEESVKERGACTGFSWINDKGEKISGAIGENTKWLERRDRIYYTTKPEYPNVAFNCHDPSFRIFCFDAKTVKMVMLVLNN